MINWKQIEIGKVLIRNDRFEKRQDNKSYTFAGIYSFSKGVLIRKPVKGNTFKLPFIQRIKKGDFVYSKIMAWEGGFALVPPEADNMVLSGAFVSYTVNCKFLLPEFLDFYFKIESIWKQAGSHSTGTNMRRKMLHPQQFEKSLIKIPPIEEQKKIIDKLFILNCIIKKINSLLADQKESLSILRQSILQESVQGKLTKQDPKDEPASKLLQRIKAEKQKLIAAGKLKKEKELPPITEDEIPFELPKGWVWCRLGELILSINNGLYKPESFYKSDGNISLRMFNIQDGTIDFNDARRVEISAQEKKIYKLDENDILVNRVNSAELVGKAAIIPKHEEELVYESMNMRVRLFLKDDIASYINSYLRTSFVKEYFMGNLKQAISQASINQTQVSNLLIPLSPISEQRRIVAKVEHFIQQLQLLENQVEQSQIQAGQLLQAVLKEAFSNREKVYEENEMMTMAAEE